MKHDDDDKDKELKEPELPEGAVDELLEETDDDEEEALSEMVDDEKAWE